MNNEATFPIKIRGISYIIIQRKNIIEVAYDDDGEPNEEAYVPDEEANIVVMYLMDEGFIK